MVNRKSKKQMGGKSKKNGVASARNLWVNVVDTAGNIVKVVAIPVDMIIDAGSGLGKGVTKTYRNVVNKGTNVLTGRKTALGAIDNGVRGVGKLAKNTAQGAANIVTRGVTGSVNQVFTGKNKKTKRKVSRRKGKGKRSVRTSIRRRRR